MSELPVSVRSNPALCSVTTPPTGSVRQSRESAADGGSADGGWSGAVGSVSQQQSGFVLCVTTTAVDWQHASESRFGSRRRQ